MTYMRTCVAALAFAAFSTTPLAGAAQGDGDVSPYIVSEANVDVRQMVGTWGEAVGVAAYASAEQLESAGGEEAAKSISNKINSVAQRVGVGDLTVEFSPDGTVVARASGNSQEGTYEVSEGILSVSSMGATFSMVVRCEGDKLYVFYPVGNFPSRISKYFTDFTTEGLYLGAVLTRQ